uniref:Major facilitator superfamily (MFS) profile domain-containing protein n=1 Tax=Chromera velia CCMP2878 TaxID=1169474 RepID=A0A0G4FKD9_9ALVE|eukprot:Cvel_3463.t1-p1 / transcript=Cvel_3463.t1 / gene=Cvel_3463 / organism=Chromera_velia_CCMP2878 / gene_product=Peptide transporter PTR5, putative / transcript_product=Peptide transporter PTR5, putative / location=Cvel_scaffold139:115926-121429(-) / protein_length=667 / sequence_SO=supercontig / SO=protein_coding / is_pseudo=false
MALKTVPGEDQSPVDHTAEDTAVLADIPEKYKTGDKEKPWKYTDEKNNVYTYYANPMWKAAVFVLVLEMLERFAYYCLQPEYNRYLTNDTFAGMSVAEASSTIKLMTGLGYLWPLLSAAIADSFMGVYTGILVTSVVYIGALTLMTIAGSPSLYQSWMTPVYFFLWFPLGFGGIKSLVGTMGANQFHPEIHKDRLMSYWLKFYIVINIGALVSTAVNVYANTVGNEMWKPFSIPTVAFAFGFVAFLVGSWRYVKRKPLGSSLVQLLKVVWGSVSTCPPNLEAQKRGMGGKFPEAAVDDTRRVLNLVPLIFIGTFFFSMSYWQMDTYVLFQGYEMRPEGPGGLFDSNVLNSFINPLAVVFFAFIVERLLLPYLDRKGIVINHINKFMIACCCAIVALVYAAGIDLLLRSSWSPDRASCPSILLLSPVYAIIALGEVWASPAALDLAYRLAPPSTKAIAIGLHGITNGMVPNFVSSALSYFTQSLQVDENGCKARHDKDCETPLSDPAGKATWNYRTVNIWLIYVIAAVFPVIGLIVLQFSKGYYKRLMALHSAEGETGVEDGASEDDEGAKLQRRRSSTMGDLEGGGDSQVIGRSSLDASAGPQAPGLSGSAKIVELPVVPLPQSLSSSDRDRDRRQREEGGPGEDESSPSSPPNNPALIGSGHEEVA